MSTAERTCRYCGCTDERACQVLHALPGGTVLQTCTWMEADLCSACWRFQSDLLVLLRYLQDTSTWWRIEQESSICYRVLCAQSPLEIGVPPLQVALFEEDDLRTVVDRVLHDGVPWDPDRRKEAT